MRPSLQRTATLLALLLCCVVAWTWTGVHWGWVDDVLRGAHMFGHFSVPDMFRTNPGDLTLDAQFVAVFQRLVPSLNMHGVVYISAIALSGLVLFRLAASGRSSVLRWSRYLITSLLILSSLHELTFTRVSLILCVAGSAWIVERQGIRAWLVSIPLMLYALMVRSLAVAFAAPILGLAVWAVTRSMGPRLRFAGLLVGLVPVVISLNRTVESRAYVEHRDELITLLYMLDTQEWLPMHSGLTHELSERDELLVYGLSTWFFFDRDAYDEAFLQRALQAYRRNALSPWQSLRVEIWKAGGRYDHRPWKRWLWPFVMILLLPLLASLLGRRSAWHRIVPFTIAVLLTLVVVGGVHKLEDRAVLPALSGAVFLLCGATWWSGRAKFILLAGFSILLLWRGAQMIDDRKVLDAELAAKRAWLNEVDRSRDGLFVYDLWTMTLMHGRPWERVSFSEGSGRHIVFGEGWMNIVPAHRALLRELTGSTSFDAFLDHLWDERHRTELVLTDLRADFLERYLQEVKGRPWCLEVLPERTAIERCDWSFTWSALPKHHYRIHSCPASDP